MAEPLPIARTMGSAGLNPSFGFPSGLSVLVAEVGRQPAFSDAEVLAFALAASLPDGKKKAYVVVEFIVDSDGTPTNFKMVQGVDEEFNDEVITVLEQMPVWQPAILNDKPVAKKIRQGFGIEKSK